MAVRREPNGVNLYWFQDGEKIVVNMVEEQYAAAQATQDAQVEAKRANAQAKFLYMNEFNAAQEGINSRMDILRVPIKPLMIVVADPIMDDFGNVTQGVETHVDWIPPLPDLKPKLISAGPPPVYDPINVAK